MLSIKVQIAVFLYQIGIRKVLPSAYVNQIKIKENHDQLVDIKPHKSFFWGEKLQNKEKVFLRAAVYQKLCELEQILPENYLLRFIRHIAHKPNNKLFGTNAIKR